MDDLNCKTIFVLDHTPYFSIPSEDYLPLDFHSVPNSSSLMQFSKSLWTCSVESSIEYCRIVWDLFPREKLVRLIVSDNAAHIVNTWLSSTQNMAHVLNAMSLVGVPQRDTLSQSSEFSVIHGLRTAVEGLSELTESQNAQLRELQRAGRSKNELSNKGRVICITSTRDNSSIKSLEDIFYQVLLKQNQIALADENCLPIQHCHLVLINVVPLNVEAMLVSSHARVEVAGILSTEVHSTRAPEIANKLTHLILSHYDLASTTVTGIPMKEEQNANSSANYDVEIVHARNAHTVICGNESLLPISIKEGVEYETVTLKWCTPRGCGASDMQACLAQHRVTPVDVTSRPSACLINFLLNGRSVLLEMPRKTAGKTTSHLLSARGGEIFIHALQITRSPVEDPPAITEGPGGRVSDYRTLDFANLMKVHRLLPLKNKQTADEGLHRLRERLHRRTQYFPLTNSSSVVYNLQRSLAWLPSFLHLIAKENMDKTDETMCQQYIFDLYQAATRKDPLVFTNMSMTRLRGNKKMEQYRLLCLELEQIIRAHATTSHHKLLLESVQNVRQACCDGGVKADSDGSRDSTGRNIIRCTTDSPLSPPHSIESSSNSSLPKSSKKSSTPQHGVGLSLDAIFAIAERKQTTKRMDFVGRLTTPPGQIATLYPTLGAKEKEAAALAAASGGKEEIVSIK